MINHHLSGHEQASKNRELVGNYLGIGYNNAKTFLKKLNAYGISYEAFQEALEKTIENASGENSKEEENRKED